MESNITNQKQLLSIVIIIIIIGKTFFIVKTLKIANGNCVCIYKLTGDMAWSITFIFRYTSFSTNFSPTSGFYARFTSKQTGYYAHRYCSPSIFGFEARVSQIVPHFI